MSDANEPDKGKQADVAVDVDAARNEAREAEANRVRGISALTRKWGARLSDLDKKADEFIDQGRSFNDFQAHVMERLEEAGVARPAKPEDLNVGLSGKEKRDFSLVRLINYEAAVRKGEPVPEAGRFEKEVVTEAEKKAKEFGRHVRGVLIPEEVLIHQREMQKREVQVGGTNSSGELVATNLLAADFIELLRNATKVMGLGPTVLSGLVGNVAIPRQTGAASTYWVAESGAPTESDQSFDQVTMSPTTLAANTKYSRKTLLQSTPSIEGLVRSDLATVMGIELDRAAINGSGSSNQPTGILQTSGIGSVALGTDGGAPTWAKIIALVEALGKANALRGNLAFLGNAQVSATLRTTEKASGYPVYIQEALDELAGYRFGQSQNVPSDLTKGTGTALSALIFGNWSDLLIGEWGGLDMIVDPYSYSTQGGVQITIFRDVDIAVRHAASFAAITDMITN